MKKGALWRKFFMAKYSTSYVRDYPIESKHGSMKAPWRNINIIKALDWFRGKIKWHINNGESITFWKGNWSDLGPLTSHIPRLYALSCCQNGSIKDNWDQIAND